jgi:transposase
MLGVAMYITIETLYKQGLNKTEIARVTKHDWKTIDKVIKAISSGSYPEKKPHLSKLDNYKEKILEYLESDLSAVRVYELLSELGCPLSYSSVKTYIRSLKGRSDICIRFHTNPGEEAQVDFGYVGKLPDNQGKIRKAWVFNMRLSYSRLDFYKVVFDQKVETFIQCHIDAFNYFGGIPALVRIDNLKAAILEANFYQPIYQSLYKQFADYHSFEIIPCRVRKPQEKGKVESGIKYIKNNFFAGRKFTSNLELNIQLESWLNDKCNVRIHGTTRKVPRELFEEKERSCLKSLPNEPFRQIEVGSRKVYRDCHTYIDYSYYSVPFDYVGKDVDFELDEVFVRVFYEGKQIALHERCKHKGQFATQEIHYPSYKLPFSGTNKNRLEDKMKNIGQYANQLFSILLVEQPNHWYQTTHGILSLQKKYSKQVIDAACHRGLSYGAIKYQQIKSICESGCYNLPISHEESVH